MTPNVVPLPQIDAAAVALRVFNFVTTYFDDQGWDLPARRYIAAGSPTILAADDEHFAVGLASMASGITPRSLNATSGAPGRGARSMHVPRANYSLRLMRCVATIDDSGEPPSAEELFADGVRLLDDPGRLMTALFAWVDQDRPFNQAPQTVIGDLDVIGPMGGLAGHVAKFTIGSVQ